MKILVSDKLSDAGVEILKNGGFTVDVKTGLNPEELKGSSVIMMPSWSDQRQRLSLHLGL